MSSKNLRKKSVAVLAGTAITVGGAGVAYAYWSTSGEGTGSATTSAGAANLTVVQTSTISNMFPGDAPQTIAGTVTNKAENAAYVSKVTVSIKSVTPAADAIGDCDASDYSLTAADMLVGKDLATGEAFDFSGATLQFNNKANANQDGCKGATVNLAYAAS